jgi:large subunit ribosomal protein L10
MSDGYAVKVRPEKVEAVNKIRDELGSSQAAVVTEYRGLTVNDLKALRSQLDDVSTSYRVSKNTLVRLAVNELGLSDLVGLLEGPVAVAYVKGDPIAAAKVLASFAKTHPNLVIKGGLLDGRVLSGDETKDLANVDPLDVSRAKIMGMLTAPLQRIMMLLEAPAGRILFVLEELAKRGPAEDTVATESDESAPAEPTAEPARPAEAMPEPAGEAEAEASAEVQEAPAEAPAETPEAPAEAPAETPEAPAEPIAESEPVAEQETSTEEGE